MTGLIFIRRKSDAQLKLPTWLRLGLKIAGYGILGTHLNSRLIDYETAGFVIKDRILQLARKSFSRLAILKEEIYENTKSSEELVFNGHGFCEEM